MPIINEQTSVLLSAASALRIVFGALWLITVFVHVEYAIPLTPFGPVGDGASDGYNLIRASGVSAGAFVVETRHRTSETGWEVELRPKLPYLLPYFYGTWPIRVYAFPLFLPVLILTFIIWQATRRSRSLSSSIKGM